MTFLRNHFVLTAAAFFALFAGLHVVFPDPQPSAPDCEAAE